jgi:hypothetical protein
MLCFPLLVTRVSSLLTDVAMVGGQCAGSSEMILREFASRAFCGSEAAVAKCSGVFSYTTLAVNRV